MSLKILIVGAGAVGGYFGARLTAASRDVTFLVRPKRAEALQTEGLQIESPHGDITIQPKLVTADALATPFDLIFLSVKGFALEAALQDLTPAVGPNTMILPVLNGMAHMDRLQIRFGRAAVLGGVCRIGVTLDGGIVRQLMPLQQIGYGELDGTDSERIRKVDATLQGAGFDAAISPHIVQDMWDKWVQLASLGAATCLLRGTVGEIVAVPEGRATAQAILQEAAEIARASGYPPSENFMAATAGMLSQPGSPMTSSMYRDLLAGAPVEVDAILHDLVERGRSKGVQASLLKAAAAQLHIYQNGRA